MSQHSVRLRFLSRVEDRYDSIRRVLRNFSRCRGYTASAADFRDLRVLYNVEESEVVLLVVGRKVGNKLIVTGEEFHGHQHDPTESPGDGPAGDA